MESLRIDVEQIVDDHRDGNCPFCHEKAKFISFGLVCDEHGEIKTKDYFNALVLAVEESVLNDEEDMIFTGTIIGEDHKGKQTILLVDVGDMVGWPHHDIKFTYDVPIIGENP